MTTTQDKVVQYLTEAHAMEVAMTRTLQAQRSAAPTGPYRALLDEQLETTREHAARIRRRLADLRHAPGVTDLGYGIAQRVVGQLWTLGTAPLELLRGTSAAERRLRNAREACAAQALEIASYDALEALAERAGDARTAVLAREHRAEDERTLTRLRALLPELAAAVAAEADDGSDGAARGAATVAHEAARAARDLRRTATEAAGDALRTVKDVTGTTSPAEQHERRVSPFTGYDDLNVAQVTAKLPDLTPAQLRHVERYERAHKRRRGVLDAVERQQRQTPTHAPVT